MTKKSKAEAETPAADTTPTTILSVPLDELEHDPIAIKGHEARLTQLDDLLASLPIKGQLQSLKVRPSPSSDVHSAYWVTAGNRRLAALRALQARGGSIRGVVVTGEYPVHVIVSAESDADAYESSRSENLQRLPETPVEEFRAFAKMAESKTPREIAAVFGITEKRVQQRLKLAALHADVVAALEAGKISMEAAQAFTIEADPARQAAYLKKHLRGGGGHNYNLLPSAIRGAFTDDLVNGDHTVAQIIGRDAYLAAGGQMLGDVFDDASYWISPEVIERCLAAHWETQVAAWKEEGWSFVEPIETFLPTEQWKINYCDNVGSQAPDHVKAVAGVVYWPNGDREPIVGIKRYAEPKDRLVAATPDLLRLPEEARAALTGVLDQAVAARLLADHDLTLRLLVASLRCGQYEPSPVAITRDYDLPAEDDEDEAVSFVEALRAEDGKSRDELIAALVEVVVPGMEVLAPFNEGEMAFLGLVQPEVTFDPGPYFKGLTKPLLELALRDMTDPDAGEKPPKGKIEELVAKARQRAADTGWLPPQLRTPSYTGPCFVTGVADEGDDEEADAGEADDFNDDDQRLDVGGEAAGGQSEDEDEGEQLGVAAE